MSFQERWKRWKACSPGLCTHPACPVAGRFTTVSTARQFEKARRCSCISLLKRPGLEITPIENYDYSLRRILKEPLSRRLSYFLAGLISVTPGGIPIEQAII